MRNIIKPIDIVDNPTDPYRIAPILEELRVIWSKNPECTFGEILCRIIDKEYEFFYLKNITDDELVASIQNLQKIMFS